VGGQLQHGFAQAEQAVGLGCLADDVLPCGEVVEQVAGAVGYPLRVVVVVHGRGVAVGGREHVAAEAEVGVGQLQLCEQRGGEGALVADDVDGARLPDGTAQPEHGYVVLLERLLLVDAAVVDAVVGGDDDERALPEGRLAQALHKVVEAVVHVGEGVQHLVGSRQPRPAAGPLGHVPRLVAGERAVADEGGGWIVVGGGRGEVGSLWLRWAALLHDIGKPRSKRWDPVAGWTFKNHNYIGQKMVSGIFHRLKLPLDERMHYVERLVGLHMRPIAIADDEVTDSAVRRLLFEAGPDIDDLMTLCEADITSKNAERKQQFLHNFQLVREKLADLQARDNYRTWHNPITGEEIMETFGLQPCREIGLLKQAVKDAIWDSLIPNNHDAAFQFMLEKAKEMNLTPISPKNKNQ